MERQTGTQTADRHSRQTLVQKTDRWTNGETDRRSDCRQTDRLTGGQADRHTYGRPEERTDIKRKKKSTFLRENQKMRWYEWGSGRETCLLKSRPISPFTFNFRVFTLWSPPMWLASKIIGVEIHVCWCQYVGWEHSNALPFVKHRCVINYTTKLLANIFYIP